MAIRLDAIIYLVFFVGGTVAYPTFQGFIPNGNNIPHPCKANFMWPGVGHENRLGGGTPNVFGQDFLNIGGMTWSRELCQRDSDGDGLSNGFELGDPNCVWRQGQIPSRTTDITHPGICDPFGSPQCQGRNDFVSCEEEQFERCEAVDDPRVSQMDLTFSRITVPATETNYYCMSFDLPSDQDYHIVANEGIIDNANNVHHQLLYGCPDGEKDAIPSPRQCDMGATDGCQIISAWTVGRAGECFSVDLDVEVGFRFGRSAFKRVILEIHYNNPRLISGGTDASGLRLYYQPARPEVQDLVTFQTGQVDIVIPPGENRVDVVGTCNDYCTTYLITEPAYVITAINHMHYLGRSMKIELFRGGFKVADIAVDEFYNYDSPVNHDHRPPIEVRPGDEIKTTCSYSSVSSNRWVYYGDATSDEMCFGFLTMYPQSAFVYPGCINYGPLDSCDIGLGTKIGDCDWQTFTNLSHPSSQEMATAFTKNCNLDGFCRPECEETLRRYEDHPCLNGEASRFVKLWMTQDIEGVGFLGRLHSCGEKGDCSDEQCAWTCGDHDDNVYDGAPGLWSFTSPTISLLVAAAVMLFAGLN